ncbi:hypothetical protein A2W14_04115 [Candidatus Gottesmanbacteria bacterium RBG_16_37_8]|uniref:Addiction module toxin RelE n=1 Tax=Candidatus Gottesmanbacteria bacterium RBG_16_37_8 TaxID=1798371 RepID=A0A1F5YPM2_9BACT|nr:MAG: hypothetical protein A2W14_04115 [Candidatus Gottesmanbacteria bacterium RBG_16_37_8]
MKADKRPTSVNLSKSKTKDYRIVISSKAQKDYRHLDPPIQNRITSAILKLSNTRYPQQFKSLIGKDIASFRLRVGDYRILYDVYERDETVLILRIGHRRDIYR